MSGDNSCKIIVRNLNFDSTDEDVKAFYEKWGTVEDLKVMKNKGSGKSKGWAILRYVKASEVDAAMSARPHELDGRTLEPHRASPREYSQKLECHHTCNEIFVGKWTPDITEEDLKEYFGQFGTVEEVTCPKDKKDETKFRNFAIVKFDDYDPVDVCCYKKMHKIKEKNLIISKWIDRKTMNELKRKFGDDNEDNFRGGRDNFRGGRGNFRGGRRGNFNNGGGSGDDLQKVLLQQLMGALGGQQSFEGPMRGSKRGGRGKPYGRSGQWM